MMLARKIIGTCVAALCAAQVGYAIPTLQLDADPGVYVGGSEESTVSTSKKFTLYALFQEPNNFISQGSFYIVTSVVPKVNQPGGNFGSFSVNGENVNVTSDLVFGQHPLINQAHGIFDTYYRQFQFQFDLNKTATPYDVESQVGIPNAQAGTDFYYEDFDVDLTGLADGYTVHFDLVGTYNVRQGQTGSREVTENAPFSHDVTGGGNNVPDGASTLILLGSALAGVASVRRYFKK